MEKITFYRVDNTSIVIFLRGQVPLELRRQHNNNNVVLYTENKFIDKSRQI